MIFGARSTELLFKVWQRALISIHLLNFKFSKSPKHCSVLYNRHVIECDVCDRGIVDAQADTCTPDSQGRHRHEPPSPEMEKEQIAERGRWTRLAIDEFNFLPVLQEGKFQLPSLFPAFDSMTESDPRLSQVVLGSIVVG
jgi:hypothetical protein